MGLIILVNFYPRTPFFSKDFDFSLREKDNIFDIWLQGVEYYVNVDHTKPRQRDGFRITLGVTTFSPDHPPIT